MQLKETNFVIDELIYQQCELLGHRNFGVTELMMLGLKTRVAYVDNPKNAVQLVKQVQHCAHGIYIGVQPRPLWLFDKAPNCWVKAVSKPESNCAKDDDIEYFNVIFFDIDVDSEARRKGLPASDEELKLTLEAARLISRLDGFVHCSTICCSGNGHYLIARIVPIAIDSPEIPLKFKYFCQRIARDIADHVKGTRIDSVYNMSRVMREMGTRNCKGQPTPDRPHRIAHFATEPAMCQSMALHHMILNTEVPPVHNSNKTLVGNIKCDLDKIEKCAFVKWCRNYPKKVIQPQWFALATNLVPLEGGSELFHEISELDGHRYKKNKTQQLIDRILSNGYHAVRCKNLSCFGFNCQRLQSCRARAPMHLTY
jgi:hypothetical protein